MKNKRRILMIIFMLIVISIFAIATILNNSNKNESENSVTENQEDEGQQAEKYTMTLEDGSKVNISEKLAEPKTIDGLEIKDIELVYKDNQTRLKANVVNNSKENFSEIMVIDITFVDEQQNTIQTTKGLIQPMPVGETVELNAVLGLDYSNVYNFLVQVSEE